MCISKNSILLSLWQLAIVAFCIFVGSCVDHGSFGKVSLQKVSGKIEGSWVIDKSLSYFINSPGCDAFLLLEPGNKFTAECLSINSIFTRKSISDAGAWSYGVDINDDLVIKLVLSDGSGVEFKIYEYRNQGYRLVHKLEQPDEQYQLVLMPDENKLMEK